MIEEKMIKKLNCLRKQTICQYCLFYLSLPFTSSFLFLFTTYISIHTLFLTFIIIYLMFINYVFYQVVKPKYITKYIKEYKSELLKRISALLHEELFEKNKGLEEDDVLNSRLLPFFTKFHSLDLIEGQVEDCSFQACHIDFYHYYKKNEQITFRGQWYHIKFKQKFKATTFICGREIILNPIPNLKETKTDDAKFNQCFSIYTNHEEETKRLLDLHFKERINLLERKYKGKLILIFENKDLYIGINNNRLFLRPSLFDKVTQFDFMIKIEDFLLIKNIMKYIKIMDKVNFMYINFIQSAGVS